VLAQDLIHVIFKDMDPVWLRSMWKAGRSACADMIEILISLPLLGYDLLILLRTMLILCYFGLYLFS
jgi:hypothetical protein